MDNLSRFYIELATNAGKLNAFNSGSNAAELAANRRRLLTDAGVEDAQQFLSMDSETLRQRMAQVLILNTNNWQGLEKTAGNKDNKSNIVIKKAN